VIIGGPRTAVAPVTTTPSGTQARATATIIAVVASEVLGLINRIFVNDRGPHTGAARRIVPSLHGPRSRQIVAPFHRPVLDYAIFILNLKQL